MSRLWDLTLWPHSWPWPWIAKVKVRLISRMGGPIDAERKWCEWSLMSTTVTFGQNVLEGHLVRWTWWWRGWMSLQWRHIGRYSVSNHQPHGCLLNRLFRRRSKKTSNSASLAFVWGIHRGPVNSPHKWPVTRKMFPFDNVIMMMVTWVDVRDSDRSDFRPVCVSLTYPVVNYGCP